jgi:lysozyme
MQQIYLDAIKQFEGFSQKGVWDFKQVSSGYGTRAKYVGEVIDKAEAERRFRAEIEAADSHVRKFAPGLDPGTQAALTSLTYNAGTAWMRDGLGDAVKRGDLKSAREIFVRYTFAGGQSLPGLVARREAEAAWFGPDAGATRALLAAGTPPPQEDAGSATVAASAPSQPSSVVASRAAVASSTLPQIADEAYQALLVLLLLEHRARKPSEPA